MNGRGNDYEISVGGVTPAVKSLLVVTIAAYVAQWMLQHAGAPITRLFGLSFEGLQHLRLWQFVTYMFLHGNWLHLLLNMLVLFMMGPETERAMGRRQFLIMYFVSGVLGAVGWLIISAGSDPRTPCVGASGAIFGIIGAFAALFPHRRITLLLFFVFPVTMKAWVLALVLAGMEAGFLLSNALGGHVANAAHLGGGLAGYVYAHTAFRRGAGRGGASPLRGSISLRLPKKEEDGIDMREVDRILDKIEREGMASLTRGERDLLHRKSHELRE